MVIALAGSYVEKESMSILIRAGVMQQRLTPRKVSGVRCDPWYEFAIQLLCGGGSFADIVSYPYQHWLMAEAKTPCGRVGCSNPDKPQLGNCLGASRAGNRP